MFSRAVTGFVLTGGQSTRMGQDKALLPVQGQTLCEHIGDVVSLVAEKVLLVGHPERYGHLKYACLPDRHPDLGPLSGLETALTFGAADLNVVAGCDVANIKVEWLRTLIREAPDGVHCAVVEDAASRLQPLCGVYRSDCLPVVRRALEERRLRMMDLLTELGAKLVRVDELVVNLNSAADWAGFER